MRFSSVLVSDISNIQQWQQSTDRAEIQLLALGGGGETRPIRMSSAGARTDESSGWGASKDAGASARRFVREHKTERG